VRTDARKKAQEQFGDEGIVRLFALNANRAEEERLTGKMWRGRVTEADS